MGDFKYVDAGVVKTGLSVEGNLSPYAPQASQIAPRQNLGLPASIAILNSGSDYSFGTSYYNIYLCLQPSGPTKFNLPVVSASGSINDGSSVNVYCPPSYNDVDIYDNTFSNLITTIKPGQLLTLVATGFTVSPTTGWTVVQIPQNMAAADLFTPTIAGSTGATGVSVAAGSGRYFTCNNDVDGNSLVNLFGRILFTPSSTGGSVSIYAPFMVGNFATNNNCDGICTLFRTVSPTGADGDVGIIQSVAGSQQITIPWFITGLTGTQYSMSFSLCYQLF